MASVITIDDAGRIVVPQALRQLLGLVPGTKLRADVEGERLVLEAQPTEAVLREEDGLLIVGAPVEGAVPDHRETRVERAIRFTR